MFVCSAVNKFILHEKHSSHTLSRTNIYILCFKGCESVSFFSNFFYGSLILFLAAFNNIPNFYDITKPLFRQRGAAFCRTLSDASRLTLSKHT